MMMRPLIFLLAAAAAFGFETRSFQQQQILQNNYAIEKVLRHKDKQLYEKVKRLDYQTRGTKEAMEEPVEAVLYLTSSTVPPKHMMRLAKEAAAEGVTVHPLLRGMDDGTAKLAQAMMDALDSVSPQMREAVRTHIDAIRISPKLFRELNATAVPVIVVARCKGGRPYLRYCELLTAARGETSLMAMAQRRFGPGAAAQDLFTRDAR